MRRFIAFFVIAAVVALAGCTARQQQNTNDGRTSCKWVTETGSRIPKEVCRTEEEEDMRTMEDQLELERLQRNTFAEQPK